MAKTYTVLFLFFFVLGCGGSGEELPEPTFEVSRQGQGEANTLPLWPLSVGSYITDVYTVESSRDGVFRVVKLNAKNYGGPGAGDVEHWIKDEKGLALVKSPLLGKFEVPILLVPKMVRDGMTWKTSEMTGTAKRGGIVETAFGPRQQWTLTIDDIEMVFKEGLGPDVGERNGGLIVEDSEGKGVQLPKAVAGEKIGDLNVTYLGATDISGSTIPYMLHTEVLTNNLVGTPPFVSAGCWFFQRVLVYANVEETVCPIFLKRGSAVAGNSGVGFPTANSGPENGTPTGDGSVVWHRYAIDSDEPTRRTFAPHIVDGGYFAFYRAIGNTHLNLTEDGASERPPSSKDVWGVARRTKDATGGSFDRTTLDHSSSPKPARVLLSNQGWIQPAFLDEHEQSLPGRGIYFPGVRSVRMTDEGREIFITRPDGVVYKIDIEDGEIQLSLVANLEQIDGHTFSGAVRYKDEILYATQGIDPGVFGMVGRSGANDKRIKFPDSFRFLVGGEGGTAYVCLPKGVAMADIDLKISGKSPTGIFEAPESRRDGCGLVTGEPSQRSVITANLPGVGRVTAVNNFTQLFLGGKGGIPKRGGGFTSRYFDFDANGLILQPVDEQQTPGSTAKAIQDSAGYGYWVGGGGSNQLHELRLASSNVEWEVLPFEPRQLVTADNIFPSDMGHVYVCGKLTTGEQGCIRLGIDGKVENVDRSLIINNTVTGGGFLVAELSDGRLCYKGFKPPRKTVVWCGEAVIPEEAAVEIIEVPTDVMPFKNGFYFRTENSTKIQFFNADSKTISELSELSEQLFGPWRISEDILVAADETKVYRIEGTNLIEVFDSKKLPFEIIGTLLPGSENVLIGNYPVKYDPSQ